MLKIYLTQNTLLGGLSVYTCIDPMPKMSERSVV